MVHENLQMGEQRFPLWRALGLIEDFVAYAWREGSFRPLEGLGQMSRPELDRVAETFELVFLAAVDLRSATTELANDTQSATPSVSGDPGDVGERVRQVLDEKPSGAARTVDLDANREDDSPEAKTWALIELLSLVDAFVAPKEPAKAADEVVLQWARARLANYDDKHLRLLQRAGDSVHDACGLVLMEVERLVLEP